MVVAFDAKGIRVVLVELHDAGITAVDHVRCLDREDELLEEYLRGLGAAVLRPRLAETLQFDVRRLSPDPPEVLLDAAHFVEAEGEPHLLTQLGEVRGRSVAQEDVVQGERGGPPSQPLVHPLCHRKDKRPRYIMLLVRSGTPPGMEASSSSMCPCRRNATAVSRVPGINAPRAGNRPALAACERQGGLQPRGSEARHGRFLRPPGRAQPSPGP